MPLNISRPTLLLDSEKMEHNIDKMIRIAGEHEVRLVPHFKTHQSKEIGSVFSEKGIEAITVSSVEMAEYFARSGWKDITIAFPFNRLETTAVNTLMENGVRMKLLVTDIDTVNYLAKHLTGALDLLIEIDTGYGRSGVLHSDQETLRTIAEAIHASPKLNFYGLYCHLGNTYHADGIEEIQKLWSRTIEILNALRHGLKDISTELKIRMGDTPGCSVVQDMNGVDEIGPGNFVFYDLVMNYLDVCTEDEIAVAVACPVVAKHEDRMEVVIHGGAVHFSKDHLFDAEEQKFFGELVILEEKGWSSIIEGAKLTSISQEHGILRVTEELFETLRIGDVVGILPIHSCLTANLMRSYISFDGQKLEHM